MALTQNITVQFS